MEELDLDLNYNEVASDVMDKKFPRRADMYQRVVKYANLRGMTQDEVDEVIYSSADGSLKEQAEKTCEAEYEKCLEGLEAGDFGDCGSKLQPCKDRVLAELKKSKNKGFWDKVGVGLNIFNKTAQNIQNANQSGTGTNTNTTGNNPNDKGGNNDDDEVTILGMKPLVFGLVSLLTVTALGIGIFAIVKRGKKG